MAIEQPDRNKSSVSLHPSNFKDGVMKAAAVRNY